MDTENELAQSLTALATPTLWDMLKQLVVSERFWLAAKVRDELQRRREPMDTNGKG